ncbi:hypothetical protein COY96_02790, partial [Candidatus Wolfebacteria bacterium CG_4_10_14_0_8_um_filter_37_11]
MLEKNLYNLKKAQEEAAGMQEKIESGKAKDYAGAEKLVEKEKTKEIILTTEQKTAKQGMIDRLSKGYIYSAIQIKDKFNLPEELISSPEIQQAANQGMIDELSNGYIDKAIQIKDKFNLPEELISSPEIQQAAKQG